MEYIFNKKISSSKPLKKLGSFVFVFILTISVFFELLSFGIFGTTEKVSVVFAAEQVDTFTSSGTWQAPTGVTSVSVELWGGGGGGGKGCNSNKCGGGGGAGGQYSIKTVAVTPGNSYNYVVGGGGAGGTSSGQAGNAGGDTTFNSTSAVAKGGVGGGGNAGSGATGGAGSVTGGVGDTVYPGGNGANGNGTGSGGGGGGAGSTGAGGSASGITAGTGTSQNGGSGGGGTTANSANGSNASNYGGGGGGSTRSGNGGAGAQGLVRLTYTIANTTTIGTGTDPSSTTVAPESGIVDAGAFTLQTDANGDSVTALTVTLAGSGTPYDGVAEVRITSDNGSTLYYSAISNPSSNTLNFSGGTPIPVSTTQTQFKIRITPKTHANMPAVPGAEYALLPYVSAFTSTNQQAGTDTNANTLTIDNLSPGNVTSATATAGDTQVSLSWTNPADSDLSQIIVLRRAGTATTDTPVEGSSYSVGNTVGDSTVACVVSSPTTNCTDTGLTNGTAYHYRIYTKDSRGNYSQTGVVPTGSPATPVAAPTVTTQSATSITATGATLNGNITSTGGADVTVRGFAWGTNSGLSGGDTATTTENGTFGTGAFTNSSLTLTCNTTYYSRAYATNSVGTSYGAISASFTTSACASGRYWVGGGSSSDWNATGPTNWSETSGGANNASIPTTDDDVFFDSASNATAYTVDVSGTVNTRNITIGNPASGVVTIQGAGQINVAGDFSASSGILFNMSGGITFTATSGTKTITTNGNSMGGRWTFNGPGGTFQLADNFTWGGVQNSGRAMTLTAGTFDPNGKTVTLNGGAGGGKD